MKKILIPALFTLLIPACNQQEPKTAKLDTPIQKFSYAQGLEQGKRLKTVGMDVDAEAYILGIQDSWAAKESRVKQADLDSAKQIVFKQMQEKKKQEMLPLIEKGKAAEKAYLDSNGKRKEVVTTKSGLQYEILKKGTGKQPGDSSKVTVNYKGSLLDGTEFDNSYKRGQPAVFPVNRVIPGWTEALKLMHVGSKWKVAIPYALAYGENGRGQRIPPASTLLFEMELLKVE